MKRAAELFTFELRSSRSPLIEYVSGSGTLVRALLADGLVDELHLVMYPLTRGAGPRLFTEDARARELSLAACEAFSNGVVYLNYRARA